MHYSVFAVFLLVSAIGTAVAQSNAATAADGCGEVVTIATHGGSTTRYALAQPQGAQIALMLLVGLVLVLVAVSLPFVGGLVNLLLTVTGFGLAVLEMIRWYRESGRVTVNP